MTSLPTFLSIKAFRFNSLKYLSARWIHESFTKANYISNLLSWILGFLTPSITHLTDFLRLLPLFTPNFHLWPRSIFSLYPLYFSRWSNLFPWEMEVIKDGQPCYPFLPTHFLHPIPFSFLFFPSQTVRNPSLFCWSHFLWLIPNAAVSCLCVLSHFSCVQLCSNPWTVACQIPLSMGFSRQEY